MTIKSSYLLKDFNYDLPEERIAQYPLDDRAASRLLFYNQGEIRHQSFRDLPNLLPQGALLIFNNTKVFPARTFFRRKTGAIIQVFLLEPDSMDIQQAMSRQDKVQWSCIIGHLKKWKDNEVLTAMVPIDGKECQVIARLVNREQKLIEFEWECGHTFSHVIHAMGQIPLPPYIKRESETTDLEHYQTVYALHEGAVAAPTAGLHFTNDIIEQIKEHSIGTDYLTLHVGAGTFQPMTSENVIEHDMHSEHFEVTQATIQNLIANPALYAVGTTSLRTLESLYWAGVKVDREEDPSHIEKMYPYEHPSEVPYVVALENLLRWMVNQNRNTFLGSTAIMIMPGYQIRSAKGLVTNFHLPQSTLIMLVAAFIGEDWKKVYGKALEKGYRFLSYGDSSLLIR